VDGELEPTLGKTVYVHFLPLDTRFSLADVVNIVEHGPKRVKPPKGT
jgi:hypothetical protein